MKHSGVRGVGGPNIFFKYHMSYGPTYTLSLRNCFYFYSISRIIIKLHVLESFKKCVDDFRTNRFELVSLEF